MSDKQLSAGGNSRPFRLEYKFKNDPVADRIFELVVTTRTPAYNTRIPYEEQPTPDEMSIIVARTMTNWKNVMQSIIFDMELPEKRLAGIKAIRNGDDIEESLRGIPESDALPYVTVWNMTNYYHPGLSITVHSYDDGSEALAIAKAHIAGIEIFEKYCEKMGFYIINKLTSPEDMTTNAPPPQDANRIGRNADTLPDTPQINVEVDSTGLRPTMLAPAGSVGDLMYASGKNDAAWKFALWATKKLDYQNRNGIQYGNGEVRAYTVTGVEIKDVKGAMVAVIKTQMGNIDIFKNKKGSDENTYDWQAFVQAMAQIGILIPQLIVGFKKSIECIALVKINHSEDGTKEYKNFDDLRAMPKSTPSPQTNHQDLDEYFGDKDKKIDIPF